MTAAQIKFRKRLDARQVRKVLGAEGKPIGRNTLERLLNRDPEFPAPIMTGGVRHWFADEIAQYIESRPRRQYQPAEERAGA